MILLPSAAIPAEDHSKFPSRMNRYRLPPMDWHSWGLFLATETALSLSPGPAVLLVISQSLRGGMARGMGAALGILAANVVWFTLSALGLGVAILAAGELFTALRWLGAAYLVFLAIRAIREAVGNENPKEVAANARRVALVGGWGRNVPRGFVLQMTNPKALLFFVAILPQFIEPKESIARQMVILGATSISAEFIVLAMYSAMAFRLRAAAGDRRWGRTVDLAVAILLLAAAGSLAMAS